MDTFPCDNCGKPIPSIMSNTLCDMCSRLWNAAYEAGRVFERKYGMADWRKRPIMVGFRPMTLVERLRNPAWTSPSPTEPPRLVEAQTRDDMDAAADHIEQLQTAIERIRLTEGISRSVAKIARDALRSLQCGAANHKTSA